MDEKANNPEGGVHECTPFSDRGRMPSRKISVATKLQAVLHLGEGVFFGSFLLRPSKEMNSRAARLSTAELVNALQ